MKNISKIQLLSQIVLIPIFIIIIVLIINSISTFSSRSSDLNKNLVEENILKYSTQCYASEGSYPSDLNYLEKNYGLILNKEKYIYDYSIFASNIKPKIVVHYNTGYSGIQ